MVYWHPTCHYLAAVPGMTSAKSSERAVSTDGRLRRGERSREAIVTALFELVGEGMLQPTAQQVAERAGVGIRSVFRHFADMDRLYATMDERLSADARPILREGARQGSLRERVRGLVARRARLYERIAPYKRSANVQRWRSEFLRARHANLVRELRADLLRSLPELAEAPAEVLEAIDLVSSFEAWDRLRSDQRLSRERAEATLERALLALV
jgi:AcrR family transcriptional regulator